MLARGLRGVSLNPDVVFFILAGTFVLLLTGIQFFDPINIYFYSRDVWHHTAALNALIENPLSATNPHVFSEAPSRSYMPWFVFLALAGKILGLDGFQTLALSAFLSMAVFMFGLRTFALEYFKNPWAPLVLFFAIIGAWGVEYEYVGLTMFETLIFGAGYPLYIVLGLGFYVWWSALVFLRNPKAKWWCLAFILLFTAFALPTHQLRTAFVIGALGVLAVFSPNGSWLKGFQIGLAVLGGLVLSKFWIYYDSLEFIRMSFEFPGWEFHNRWYQPYFLLSVTGIAFIGLLGFYDFKANLWRRELITGFSAIFAGFIIGNIFDVSIAHRFYAFWVFFLHLGLTAFILQWPLKFKLKEQISGIEFTHKAAVLTVTGVISFHAFLGVNNFLAFSSFGAGTGPAPINPIHPNLKGVFGQLTEEIQTSEVLIADRYTAYPAQAHNIKVVSIPRPAPLTPDMPERQRQTSLFFDEDLTNSARWEIINRYQVRYIGLNKILHSPEFILEISQLGELIMEEEFLMIFRINFSQKSTLDEGVTDKQ